tara:strand:- start:456 stop:596 length:141 start_codon:yes stop_codon:yes gene_type:complete
MAKKDNKKEVLDEIVEEVPEAEVVTKKLKTTKIMIGGRMREIEVGE